MWTAAVFLGALLAFAGGAWRPVGKTRTVRLRQGDVVGTVFKSDLQELSKVEVFRGVPYAQAERFMPPSSPARFDYLEATEHGPVCPQSLVDLEGGGMGGGGRLAYLRRLIPFLKNQSEDCLNLNIYVPEQAFLNGLGGNLNVIVFIHGESFSWNSGNSYDGSTIASYGNIIFVTLNYRLGILGFLNTRNNKTTSNFGLLDQIAALRWLKDNIAAFGGDPDSITLMGHHTGAIAVNYLMLSPVSQADNGLFQRAILMSGTALSSWAESRSPEKVAHSVADQTGCQPYDLIACLRERRLQDILSVKDLPEDPAPSVDGIVVKVQPKDLMSHNNDLFTRYDLLCGVTESESYHILDSFALNQGLFNEDIKELLSKFFRQNFEAWEQSMERAMKVYGLDKPGLGPFEGRDRTLTLLSDARVVAPMAQTAVYHSTPGQTDVRTFFYVFSHRSKRGDHPSAGVSVQGEDLAYVLGVPIEAGQHHFSGDYSQEEKHLSETMMSLWVNFAKTGDPNVPRRRNYITRGHSDWVLEDVDWPTFEPNNQHYYQIQIPPRIGTKYRDNLMHFWNYFLPTWKPLQVPHAPPNKFVTSTNPTEEPGASNRLRFFDMYNPFVPASRTTTTPVPVVEEEDLAGAPWILILAISLVVVVIVAAAILVTCTKAYKRLPFYRGRSLSLPSIEFDVDEVLAALEREKSLGVPRTIPWERVNINDDEEEEINIIEKRGPPVSPFIPKEKKKVPRKPKRTVPTTEKMKVEEPGVACVNDEHLDLRIREPDGNEDGHVVDVDVHAEDSGGSETEKKPEDALDKIKRSMFPKVLPDFPSTRMEFEGDSTHQKRIAPPPSPPKVPTVFTPKKDKAKVVPNFLEFHSRWHPKGNKGRKSSEANLMMEMAVSTQDGQTKEKNCPFDEIGKRKSPMKTFSRGNGNLSRQNAVSKESGIFFAEPVQLVYEDEERKSLDRSGSFDVVCHGRSKSEPIYEELIAVEDQISKFLSKERTVHEGMRPSEEETSQSVEETELQQAPDSEPERHIFEHVSIKPIVAMFEPANISAEMIRKEAVDTQSINQKEIPAKLSKSRLKFASELERLFKRNVVKKDKLKAAAQVTLEKEENNMDEVKQEPSINKKESSSRGTIEASTKVDSLEKRSPSVTTEREGRLSLDSAISPCESRQAQSRKGSKSSSISETKPPSSKTSSPAKSEETPESTKSVSPSISPESRKFYERSRSPTIREEKSDIDNERKNSVHLESSAHDAQAEKPYEKSQTPSKSQSRSVSPRDIRKSPERSPLSPPTEFRNVHASTSRSPESHERSASRTRLSAESRSPTPAGQSSQVEKLEEMFDSNTDEPKDELTRMTSVKEEEEEISQESEDDLGSLPGSPDSKDSAEVAYSKLTSEGSAEDSPVGVKSHSLEEDSCHSTNGDASLQEQIALTADQWRKSKRSLSMETKKHSLQPPRVKSLNGHSS